QEGSRGQLRREVQRAGRLVQRRVAGEREDLFPESFGRRRALDGRRDTGARHMVQSTGGPLRRTRRGNEGRRAASRKGRGRKLYRRPRAIASQSSDAPP